MRAAFAFAFAALALVACTAQPPYHCDSNAACVNDDSTAGICEVDGYCSFVDSACDSTSGQRYSSSAGDGKASTCVPKSTTACVTQIAVGIQFSCLLRSDGTVWCWGFNGDGEVGDGTDDNNTVAVPTQVTGLPAASGNPAISVSTAEEHACAMLKDGEVWCWGINDTNNLGQCDQSLTNSATALKVPKWSANVAMPSMPTCNAGTTFLAQVPTGSVVNTLSAGGEHTCAVGNDSQLYCWGENTTGDEGGQAGQDDTVLPNVLGPLVVTGSSQLTSHVLDVQSGDDFTCLSKDDNSAWCWGGNQLGELANGGTMLSSSPVAISGFGDVGELAVDDETACIVTKNGHDVWCWGNGSSGIFGPTGNTNNNVQVATDLDVTATALFGGPTSETLCETTLAGVFQCWGDNTNGEAGIGALAPVNVAAPTQTLLSSVTTVRIGQYHACALTADGTLWCWGDNTYGELGINAASTTPSPIPQRVDVKCP